LLALLALVSVQGCGSSGPLERERFYAMAPRVEIQPSPRQRPETLLVMPLAARGFAGGTQIVFRTAADPLQVQRYDLYLWEQPPGRALADALVTALRDTGLFRYVVSITDRADADFSLNGELTRFEHHPTATTPEVEIAFSMTLVVGEDRSTRFSKAYAGREPTGPSTPDAMVRAFERLSARLIAEVVRDLQRLAPKLPPRPA
jgi:cholesterol transport system auxiliary component